MFSWCGFGYVPNAISTASTLATQRQIVEAVPVTLTTRASDASLAESAMDVPAALSVPMVIGA
jgi:hypothetical protein